MKTILLIAMIAFLIPTSVQAKASGGVHDYGKEQKYRCSEHGKPGKISYLKQVKLDNPNDRMVYLKWKDSFRAHKVEISYTDGITTKVIKTDDDSKQKILGLTNGKNYSFKIRGTSNCGKGKWSKIFMVKP